MFHLLPSKNLSHAQFPLWACIFFLSSVSLTTNLQPRCGACLFQHIWSYPLPFTRYFTDWPSGPPAVPLTFWDLLITCSGEFVFSAVIILCMFLLRYLSPCSLIVCVYICTLSQETNKLYSYSAQVSNVLIGASWLYLYYPRVWPK